MLISLALNAAQHDQLQRHLFPGDGLEAAALLLCGRGVAADRLRLAVHEIHPVPHDVCRRTATSVTWPTDMVPALLDRAARKGLSLVKVHGHDTMDSFSAVDDASDRELLTELEAWAPGPHGSALMLSSGRMLARVVEPNGAFRAVDRVAVIGDDLRLWDRAAGRADVPEHARRIAQSFGAGTFNILRGLRVAVVGCSGTGSVVIDQLARNAVGELVLVDPDHVEPKNLNRIVNSFGEDASAARPKVEVARDAVARLGFGARVETYPMSLFAPQAVRTVAACDVVFGCMDSVDGRHLLNRLAAFYQLPYFDLGVKLEADGEGGVDQVCGTVHYLKPGGSSLLSRHVYDLEEVRAAGLARRDPAAYQALRKEGYIRGVAEDRPAVIQLNSLIASLAINELLARLHPYRLDPNGDFAIHRISLSHGIYEHLPDGEPCALLAPHVGRGDVSPLLDIPELSLQETA